MEPIEKTITSLDWMTITLFVGLVVLALGKYLFHKKFLNFIILPFNDKYILLHNKKGQFSHWFHLLLTLFQLINLSLFILLVLNAFDLIPYKKTVLVYLIILGFLALFELVKFSLQMFVGLVFNNLNLVGSLIFSKISYLNYSSIIISIANILLIYITANSKTTIYVALTLIILINGIGMVKLLKNHQKALFPYFMYFILYLCALEIAPLVLIGSYLKG
ncbi:DUF4271 domain-containing protein [Flagellimonas halotolerans]|uniref:DUF4271 domain-containing protein n=1 Tax=Flagellimonas halotolerans TaxID=3112164 RepID=A0ABU6IP36_9FLAO|nr:MULTISPECIES: DUF4271 domain-containing protein [unclassified Allomuricauda]MEC3964852.1 DUF4271 domain-containing protein [Muricauda sp. SYSU M86414]MEC4264784.1 DUF4271 domain-containing protein [Muricauda sp. SYSU M84420]